MKNLITILFIFLSVSVFSQKTTKEDTTIMCFPVEVGKQILIDLNELDRLKEEKVLYTKEVELLNSKIDKKDTIIKLQEEKCINCEKIVEETENKVTILKDENSELRKDVKKLKRKNTIIEIVSGSIVAVLTGIIAFK
jgi:hypothetical protein